MKWLCNIRVGKLTGVLLYSYMGALFIDLSKAFDTVNLQVLVHTAAVAQWAREFPSQAEGWVIESQPRQT